MQQLKASQQLKTSTIALLAGLAAVGIGLFAFVLSWSLWQFWGGPMPGRWLLLLPGDLTLVYLWHPLFSEEINFWPKLALQMSGQFIVVAVITAVFTWAKRRWLSA